MEADEKNKPTKLYLINRGYCPVCSSTNVGYGPRDINCIDGKIRLITLHICHKCGALFFTKHDKQKLKKDYGIFPAYFDLTELTLPKKREGKYGAPKKLKDNSSEQNRIRLHGIVVDASGMVQIGDYLNNDNEP